ncbi:helix-turn-helix domain-containing protein [Brevibacillus borstelensis]|uniref:helix-turn-helix domain-containing protein n=1 Tax=Brevibacillus borstelensis TaxID=45462 RepID=UPI002040459B|nr:helix-turn-helix transcriptional regulator [Brevibacillus borstelensis]MCM3624334.1 helix-turn-helix domain-containing protein [Brevibacillus borstelensis]
MIENIFGEILRKHRKNRKLSQEDLALSADIDRSFLSEIERGVRKPTINTIFALCYALEIKPSEMIREVEEEYERKQEPTKNLKDE